MDARISIRKRVSMPEEFMPLDTIPCSEEYAVYSKNEGMVSAEPTMIGAIRAFALHALAHPKTDAVIYKRETEGWKVL